MPADAEALPQCGGTAALTNAGECVRRARLAISPAPLSGHQATLAQENPLIGLPDFFGPPLNTALLNIDVRLARSGSV